MKHISEPEVSLYALLLEREAFEKVQTGEPEEKEAWKWKRN